MTSPLTFTIQIAGTTYDIKEGSINFHPQIEQRTKLTFTVLDPNNAFNFTKGQQITLTDSASTISFTGTVFTSVKYRIGTGNFRQHDIDCNDMHQTADERTTNRIYNGQNAGVMVASMVNDVLASEGITAHYAIREDNSQADFSQGTLSGTAATSNLGGDLELAPAGSQVSIVDNLSSGTLTNCQISNGSLVPTPTATIKLQGTESLTQDGNAYVYVEIFSGGSISIISGRYLVYDVWIDPSSPEIKAGVDIVFTDGTTLRDASQDYRYYDAQNIKPHPNNDLSGFADGKWYHRSFLLDNFAGKTISYITVAIEGDKQGTYTAYFKNIYEVDSSNTVINTFFNGTFNVNPPRRMQNSGYSSVSCSIVNTYDCGSLSQRVSPSYSIDAAKIVRNSFISYNMTLPANTNILTEYSIDGGNSYIACTNNAALPALIAGLSIAGFSIQFRQTFQQLSGASPESQPMLNSSQLVVNPSYIATKTDLKLSASTTGEWNAGTLANTQVNNGVLSLLGLVRNFNPNTDLSGFTLFGDGATGPGPTTINMHCNRGTMWIGTGNNMEGHARYDSVGSWQNFRLECDVYFDRTDQRASIEYRGTADSNYDANYAYAVEFNLNAINLQRGSNSSQTTNGTRTQVATSSISIASASWHHVTIIVNGSSHQVLVDDVQYINATDSTYTASGKISFRASNANTTQGYQAQFNNFGITVIGLSGTWVSPSTSLTSVVTYGNSVVTWSDVSIGSGTSILVEATINGGTSWQTCTNGSPIPNFTAGQSLSGVNLQLRVTLSTQSASSAPQITDLVARVMGQFSSTGTRIAPVLSLASAVQCGEATASWNVNTPANTSFALSTSLDNITYNGIFGLAGIQISGLTTQGSPILDTFATNDSPAYTHLQKTGGSASTWTWDTANSRVTAVGGSSDMQLYTGVWFNANYIVKKQIVLNHMQVIGGSQTNFPVLISLTDPNLIIPTGYVQNSSGFDIIFVDSTETTKLDHEIESYNPFTGEIEMWVRIPTLSNTTDTIIYMYFCNSGISTSQENVHGVWDTNFKGVFHMDATTGSNQSDSTSSALTLTQHNSPLQGEGQIDGSLVFDGVTQYLDIAHGSVLDITGDKTIELWINSDDFVQDASSADPRILINNIDNTNVYQFVLDPASGGTIGFAVNDSTGQHVIGNATWSANTWYHLVGTYVASSHTVTFYINGVSVSNNSSLSLALGNIGVNVARRTDAVGYYRGFQDEIRVSNIVRSANWIATEYNNQSNPGTFLSLGSLTFQPTTSGKDIDVVVDMDQSDCAGVVWRQTDASNFYELDIFDASSNAGSTNVLKLFKVVANTKTQIGSTTAIAFSRGTAYRARVIMQGTSITIWFDGAIVLTATDSSLAGPGKCGMINVSGTAHFYNFRMQILGQSLSGVNLYSKVTLTSTDPTATPQLTDLILAVLHPNIALGPIIPTVDYRRKFVSANMDDIAKKADWTWQIDPTKAMIAGPRIAIPAPWTLTSKDILFTDDESPDTLSVENSGDVYRNRMILTGVLDTQVVTETHPGDGKSTSWTLQFPVVEGETPIISVNNQVKTIGQKGIDTGKDFYYAVGSTSLAQDPSGAILQPEIDSLTIEYTGQATTEVQRDNIGQFPGTTSQSQYAAISGGSGIVEAVEDVSSQQLDVASANAYGDSLLQRNGVIGRTLKCMTNRTGLSVGQYLAVFIPELGLSDASMLITDMELTMEITLVGNQASMLYYWKITACEGANLGSWQKTFLQAFN
jgi:hypothetical protein